MSDETPTPPVPAAEQAAQAMANARATVDRALRDVTANLATARKNRDALNREIKVMAAQVEDLKRSARAFEPRKSADKATTPRVQGQDPAKK